MTAPNGPILFNNSTGSDSLASGLGPSTPVNSTTEGTTASYSGAVITFSGTTDLSGVSAGDILYLVTSTGQKFFVIAGVYDVADTLTLDTAPTGTASGLSWAIGGKRASFDDSNSRRLFNDFKTGWKISVETDQSISSAIDCNGSGLLVISGSGITITQTANAAHFDNTTTTCKVKLIGFTLINTNATKTSAALKSATNGHEYILINCILGSSTAGSRLYCAASSSASSNTWVRMSNTIVFNCVSGGFSPNAASRFSLEASRCVFRDNGGTGVYTGNFGNEIITLNNCIIINNSGDGVFLRSSPTGSQINMTGCVVYGNTGDGVDSTYNSQARQLCIQRCIITANGGYGINSASGGDVLSNIDYNAFYGNTSGELNNLTNGDNDITLSADPFVDAASGDFNINNDAGGGAALRATTLTMSA